MLEAIAVQVEYLKKKGLKIEVVPIFASNNLAIMREYQVNRYLNVFESDDIDCVMSYLKGIRELVNFPIKD